MRGQDATMSARERRLHQQAQRHLCVFRKVNSASFRPITLSKASTQRPSDYHEPRERLEPLDPETLNPFPQGFPEVKPAIVYHAQKEAFEFILYSPTKAV